MEEHYCVLKAKYHQKRKSMFRLCLPIKNHHSQRFTSSKRSLVPQLTKLQLITVFDDILIASYLLIPQQQSWIWSSESMKTILLPEQLTEITFILTIIFMVILELRFVFDNTASPTRLSRL